MMIKKIAMLLVAICVLPLSAYAAKYALLVGIDNYSGSNRLQGCVHDAKLIGTLLTVRFGFPQENMKLLLDADATRDGIEAAFRTHLIQQAQPGDVVVFYYSGHGSQVPDNEGDEEDQLDETLCPIDISGVVDRTWLTDDVLRDWLSQIRTDRVTVILDSCHSGTGTKEGGLAAKMMDLGYSKGMAVDSKPSFYDPALGHVLIAASAPEQSSYMLQSGDGDGSVLTAFLAEILQGMSLDVTYEQLMQRLTPQIQMYVNARFPGYTQTPQLEGNYQQLPFWAAEGAASLPSTMPLPSEPTDNIAVMATTAKTDYVENEPITLTVQADRDCYIKVYNIRADGQVYLAFPNEWGQNNGIKGGLPIMLPGARDTFEFRASPPFGTEQVIVIASAGQFEDLRQMDWTGKGLLSYGTTMPDDLNAAQRANQATVTYTIRSE